MKWSWIFFFIMHFLAGSTYSSGKYGISCPSINLQVEFVNPSVTMATN